MREQKLADSNSRLQVSLEHQMYLCECERVFWFGNTRKAHGVSVARELCSFTAFKQAVESCAAAMELDVPELRREGADADEGGAGVSVVATAATGQGGNDGLWDDEHMAYFYETLPSLSDVVPSTALQKGKDAGGAEADVSAAVTGDGSSAGAETADRIEGTADDVSPSARDEKLDVVDDQGSESEGMHLAWPPSVHFHFVTSVF